MQEVAKELEACFLQWQNAQRNSGSGSSSGSGSGSNTTAATGPNNVVNGQGGGGNAGGKSA
jgi:hypothetical protein